MVRWNLTLSCFAGDRERFSYALCAPMRVERTWRPTHSQKIICQHTVPSTTMPQFQGYRTNNLSSEDDRSDSVGRFCQPPTMWLGTSKTRDKNHQTQGRDSCTAQEWEKKIGENRAGQEIECQKVAPRESISPKKHGAIRDTTTFPTDVSSCEFSQLGPWMGRSRSNPSGDGTVPHWSSYRTNHPTNPEPNLRGHKEIKTKWNRMRSGGRGMEGHQKQS